MPQQSENNTNLFVLRVFRYMISKKESFSIDKDELAFYPSVCPCFHLMEGEVGYYQSLADAEKSIRKIVKKKSNDAYGFLVTELPLGSLMHSTDYVSCWRYLEDGSLWLKSEGPSNLPRQLRVCNKEPYKGRDPKTIRFKQGDIVEITRGDYVELAIVWNTPSTAEQIEKVREQLRNSKDGSAAALNELSMGDSYKVVTYSVLENGAVNYCVSDELSVNVLPPSRPVPRKFATELRNQLKRAQEEEFDLPF